MGRKRAEMPGIFAETTPGYLTRLEVGNWKSRLLAIADVFASRKPEKHALKISWYEVILNHVSYQRVISKRRFLIFDK